MILYDIEVPVVKTRFSYAFNRIITLWIQPVQQHDRLSYDQLRYATVIGQDTVTCIPA